ncbi:MFS transporter [Psychrobacillus lasiicapitis]|uniref:Aromatic acid/H+ symport family MFS transporter n=1 Tax=Psychrobacillus lasiicapitis TaxID=1636719 RepID=A0A544SYJ6_9BACI|nr:aromatic acid/H+ symport family MFS transporter [Psychrobacillus lasiicapitis]TQR10283.1 aromatic acid/H+ symport family MFS transporter [Psychrobacillus lasiicapitis]GGA46959.1 MFS transporter [Psychrobacillus lasiicapitis]
MNKVNPIEIVNQSRLKGFHYIVILCLFFIMMFDGYDVVIYGATIPLLKADWGITDIVAGSIGSYTTIGTAIGAVLFGLYADRFGKKRIIIFTTFLFSFFTLLSGFAPTPIFFVICRVIAGLGFGGVMPNIAALISEYAPAKYRAAIISFIFCGYCIGAITASFSGQMFLEELGWQPVYWIGGLPLLLLPFVIRILPESISSLMKQKDTKRLVTILRKIEPTLSKDIQFTYDQQEQLQKSSVRDLFKNKLALSTMMFWLSCFCTFILMYSLNTWLPTLMMHAGYDLKSSLLFVAVLQIGAIIGTMIFGTLIRFVGFKRVLIPLYIVGAVALVMIGYSKNIYIAYGLIALIGAATVGLQNMSNAYVAEYYSVDVRAAALGSTMAFGRIGSIVAPTYMGILLTFNLQPQFNFFAISIAAIFGAIAMSFIREDRADYAKEKQVTAKKVTVLKSSTNRL